MAITKNRFPGRTRPDLLTRACGSGPVGPRSGAGQSDGRVDSARGSSNTPRKSCGVDRPRTFHREIIMAAVTSRRSLLKNSTATLAAAGLGGNLVRAQDAPIRIGVIYDLSGPFAAAGSVPCAIGAQAATDVVTARGGAAGKYKVQQINADSQSKADAAINEVERLINQEKVEIVLGVYASAHAVPLAAKVEAQKKILWITTAIATSVFKDQNRQY